MVPATMAYLCNLFKSNGFVCELSNKSRQHDKATGVSNSGLPPVRYIQAKYQMIYVVDLRANNAVSTRGARKVLRVVFWIIQQGVFKLWPHKCILFIPRTKKKKES